MSVRPPETLRALDGAKLGAWRLRLDNVRRISEYPWLGFDLYLEMRGGRRHSTPLIEGVMSLPRQDIPLPWVEVLYSDGMRTERGAVVSLSAEGHAADLFRLIATLLIPGGHLMVAYEGNDPIHLQTLKALEQEVPPVATPLGHLLLAAGCLSIKDWYWPEGWMEGPRKLRGQIPPNAHYRRLWTLERRKEVRQFLKKRGASAQVRETMKRLGT